MSPDVAQYGFYETSRVCECGFETYSRAFYWECRAAHEAEREQREGLHHEKIGVIEEVREDINGLVVTGTLDNHADLGPGGERDA